MNRLFIPISCLICVLTANNIKTDERGSPDQVGKSNFFGGYDVTLSWVVRDLVKEVKGYKDLVSEQGKMIAAEMEGLKSDLKKALNQLDVMRSEVRLISQQKLTWQNSTHAGRYFSDFAVDGVYRMSNDDGGINPISHTDDNHIGPNNMVIIDLGALFKIHTVKLWKRINPCCDRRNIGLLIYADDTLIGATSAAPYLDNLRVNGDVYASKIYVKQPKSDTVNFLEIQVFGTGPFGKDEIHC